MKIGQSVIVKHEGKVQEGTVVQMYEEEIRVRLEDGNEVIRKYWEVRKFFN